MRVVIAATILALVGSLPAQAGEKENVATSVGEAARQYMAAIDAGDLDGQMASWAEDPTATSLIMGEIWTGKANIRARSAEYVPVSKVLRNELGEIRVVPLAKDVALAVVPYRSVRRDPQDERLKAYELESMLTLVWKRTREGWRILHEHVSVKIPPPTSE
jgi:ketosteroid isomerase-like protein